MKIANEDFVKKFKPQLVELSFEEEFLIMKKLVDKTPKHFLPKHLAWCIKAEKYELAAYIRDVLKGDSEAI